MKKKEKFLLILAMTEFGRVTKSICQIWTCLVKDFLVVAGGSCNVESQCEKKCRITSTEGTYYLLCTNQNIIFQSPKGFTEKYELLRIKNACYF